MRDEVGLQLGLRREQAVNRGCGDCLPGRFDAELLCKALADALRCLGGDHIMRRPTLCDGATEQPLGTGYGKQHPDADSSGGFAKDGNVVGITAESSDIFLHPLEGGDLIEQTEVGGPVTEIEEAIGSDPVVDGYTDDAIAGKAAAVIPGRRTRRVKFKCSAGNPDHHRALGRLKAWGPNV
jgi:hypothetical protein